jgi:hypothetical protein
MKKVKLRRWLLMGLLTVIFSVIALLFWYNEWVYSLPTPVPEKFAEVKFGTRINLEEYIATEKDKPVFLHFFNPSCPCSKFNIPHFKSLAKKYGAQATFVIAVMSKDEYSEEEIRDKFGLTIPVLFDKSLAASCGVYSTPQAVILDKEHTLYFRGNYNKSRYCTDKKTNYAEIAINALVNHGAEPEFGEAALKAYGCQLPATCEKN